MYVEPVSENALLDGFGDVFMLGRLGMIRRRLPIEILKTARWLRQKDNNSLNISGRDEAEAKSRT